MTWWGFGKTPPKPQPPAAPPEIRSIQTTVRAPDGTPLLDAVGTLQPDGQAVLTATNIGGRLAFYTRATGGGDLTVVAPGYRSRTLHIALDENQPDLVLTPVVIALPRLVVRGQFLALETGVPWTAIECSDFNLYARFLNGEDIEPVLQQRADLGFNLLRVWTLMDLAPFGIGRLTLEEHPELYQRLPEFCSRCAAHGLYVEFTAYTGINDPDHWTRLCRALQDVTNVLLELVNELDQNTNEPDAQGRVFTLARFLPAPPPLLSSHGSNGSQAQPVTPHWRYALLHTNGAPEEARKVGHNAMEIWSGPTITNETSRFPDNASSTSFAFDAAAGAALLCAGSCFHSVSGKRSTLWTGTEREGAEAWSAGARSVSLECQDGLYVHRDDLEGTFYLRVYQRVLPDGRAFTVRIRR